MIFCGVSCFRLDLVFFPVKLFFLGGLLFAILGVMDDMQNSSSKCRYYLTSKLSAPSELFQARNKACCVRNIRVSECLSTIRTHHNNPADINNHNHFFRVYRNSGWIRIWRSRQMRPLLQCLGRISDFLFAVMEFLSLWMLIWVVVSNIFYFHPYLGKWSNLTSIFQMGWNHQLVMIGYDGLL